MNEEEGRRMATCSEGSGHVMEVKGRSFHNVGAYYFEGSLL